MTAVKNGVQVDGLVAPPKRTTDGVPVSGNT
jgi:hypothetical protein